MRNRLPKLAAAVLLVTAGMFASEALAADSKDKLPKAKPAQGGEAHPQPKPEKPATRTDDFKDRDNNGVDDRHEKRAIRPEPSTSPTVKQDPKPEAPRETRPVEPKATPPEGKPAAPPPKAPPRR